MFGKWEKCIQIPLCWWKRESDAGVPHCAQRFSLLSFRRWGGSAVFLLMCSRHGDDGAVFPIVVF